MEPVVIGRSDLGEAYGAVPSGVGAGLLDPAGAIPPRGRVLLGGGQPVVFIVPLMAGTYVELLNRSRPLHRSRTICSSGAWTTWTYLRGFQVRN